MEYQQRQDRASANLAERIRLISQKAPHVILGGIAVVAFVVWQFWDLTDQVYLLIWSVCVTLLSFVRAYGILPYLRPVYASDPIVPLYDRTILLGITFLAGAFWGVPAMLVLEPDNLPLVAEILVILGGVAAGSIAAYSSWWVVYLAFSLPLLLPVTLSCLILGDGFVATSGWLGLLFVVTCMLSARAYERMVVEMVDSKFAKQELVDELTKANAKLHQMSFMDSLTHIANRRGFEHSYYSMSLQSTKRQRYFSLLLMDADYFKAYNDAHGHDGGDAALVAVANVLRQMCDDDNKKPARIGGEEFAVIITGLQPPDVHKFAEYVRKAVEDLPIGQAEGTLPAKVTLSIGAATMMPLSGMLPDIDGLFHCADQALYRAKYAGRNQVVFDSFMQSVSTKSLDDLDDLDEEDYESQMSPD